MSTFPAICCLLSAFGPTVVASSAAASNRRVIEILVVGPKEARDRMDAAIVPLLGPDPEVRWASAERVPGDGAFPEPGETEASSGGKAWQIWIDVSNPTRLRVYLPALETRGATTIRTLKRDDASGEGADLVAAETAGQIVKAAILALRRQRDTVASPAENEPTAAEASQPTSENPSHLFLRFHTGYGFIRMSESHNGGTFRQGAPTFGAAVGAVLVNKLIVYAEFRATEMGSERSDTSYQPGFSLMNLGPGATYYVHPNLYLSTTVGLARLAYFDPDPPSVFPDPDMGYSVSLSAGWEWFASRHWALGLAGQYSLAWMSDYGRSQDSEIYVTSVSILFSATYN